MFYGDCPQTGTAPADQTWRGRHFAQRLSATTCTKSSNNGLFAAILEMLEKNLKKGIDNQVGIMLQYSSCRGKVMRGESRQELRSKRLRPSKRAKALMNQADEVMQQRGIE